MARKGWRLLRTKGSHNVWGAPDGDGLLAIPAHGRISPGVVRQVIGKVPDAPANWR
ncbi:MAG: type II toxin-antitoxin system HicA family toxin [Bifidobacteriaceae bacterium]|nr:type II toxin-antitoxin system HicA family toxin [Bifidobacteriaceae bacterium]